MTMKYDIIADYGTLQVYRAADGLLGMLKNNKLFEEAKWIEITRLRGDNKLYCRRKNHQSYIDIKTGEWCGSMYDPLEEYEDETIEDGLVITCNNGRFGLKAADGSELLPIIYDCILKWKDCDVIYARTGAEVRYFNSRAQQILTNMRDIEGATDGMYPYYIGEPQSNIIQLMDTTENPIGDGFCQCYGKHTGLSRRTCHEHFNFMESMCNISPLGPECHDAFLAWDCYIYASFGAQSSPRANNPIASCMDRLKELNVFKSSWEWFFVILLPQKAVIDKKVVKSVVMKEFKKHKPWIYDETYIGIGRTDRISNGAIVYATRFFRDHWPDDDGPEDKVKKP